MGDRSRSPSLAEARAACGKGDAEPFWISRFLIRPWTPYLSFVADRMGLRPSQVTVVSAIAAVSAGLVAVWPSRPSYVVSAILTVAFFVLDHVDGELARIQSLGESHRDGVVDISGKYLDRLVHYFQAPTLFLGITTGIAVSEGQPWWAVVGIVCAVGSGGFPRFTASYDLLVVAARSRSEENRAFLEKAAGFNAVYGKVLDGGRVVVVPRSMADVLAMARQYVAFPGNLFVLSGGLLFDAIRFPARPPIAVKLLTLGYAVILLGNLVYATRKYYRLLSDVPK